MVAQMEKFWDSESSQSDDQCDEAVKISRRKAGLLHQRPNPAPASPGSDRQAKHEDRNYDRKHRGDDPEGGERHPRPHHLINQPAKTREKEKQKEHQANGAWQLTRICRYHKQKAEQSAFQNRKFLSSRRSPPRMCSKIGHL